MGANKPCSTGNDDFQGMNLQGIIVRQLLSPLQDTILAVMGEDTLVFFSRQALFAPHILKTPNGMSGMGALSEAAIPRASTVRVSRGSMMPSSHRRAVL